MNTPGPTKRHEHRRPSGFTLVELLVAVGVVAFLMLGIGQIFRSVGGLVSGGTAIAEVEQMARAIERQMRDDFEALSRMPAADTFIALRMREVGDVNRNQSLDNDETAVYLTQADRDADNRDIADGLFNGPYEPGSRAITVRVDEIAFLTQPLGAPHQSFQYDKYGRQSVTADTALIRYGHALRPPRDPNWPPDPADMNAPRTPQRFYIPDGDFGQRLMTDDNRYVNSLRGAYGFLPGSDFDQATGRNEFADSFILARQSLLLAGGEIAGRAGVDGALARATFGNETEHAPYIRDLENINRFWNRGPYRQNGIDHLGARSGFFDQPNPNDAFPPAPRLIHHGRIDAVAQSLEDVKRWLQGEPFPDNGVTPVPLELQQSFAFNEGRFAGNDEATAEDGFRNFRFTDGEFDDNRVGPRAALWHQADPSNTNSYFDNRRSVRAAILGTMTRLIAEDEPPFIDRDRDVQNINFPINNFEPPTDPTDAYMDQHAIITNRCSNFEIAWRVTDPDWPRATRDIDIDNDGSPEFRPGDRIWIDITPLDTTAGNVDNSRSTVLNWIRRLDTTGRSIGRTPAFGSLPQTGNPDPGNANRMPELGYTDWRNPGGNFFDDRFREAVVQDGVLSTGNDFIPAYNPDISMGAPEGQQEYLAVWPFHAPAVNGDGFENAAFPKNLEIRVRMTLHDSQNRIPGGRTFEFIFNVSPPR